MSTINSREHVNEIIAANGKLYEDEPGATRIVEYRNAWGGTCYGVVWETDRDQYKYDFPTEYINDPKLLWEKK